jgi:hypothetical protein
MDPCIYMGMSLGNVEGCVDGENQLHSSLALLSGLDQLSVDTAFPSSCFSSLAGMREIQHLGLQFREGGLPPASLEFASTRMQRLVLQGGDAVAVSPSL